ncbi:DUF5067 domain-containing protein [Latilactobacillus curvatus]|uniref:DUF5067 domain-containing protein n=1 Tax=Latilactobacillus curvatus TaxID=28038 RepID=UPI00207327C0|nr:DUF5067 domain-containing protein [Latilactobacillus curvatus]MCM6843370.1 DUF5067 domain-containing protein [Latilactobacillus curvatus]MCM6861778.1 DUF5067 domain-containing protein [Latilactobacillus curvatus]MCM6869045.1 DUF5067 domain-containing protein [Latilactobacillus curvatus]
MKKILGIVSVSLCAISLAACGSKGAEKKTTSSSSKVEKAVNKTTKKDASKSNEIPTDADHNWFFRDNIFYAGNETMTLNKSEVLDGSEAGSKVLVLHTTILNNSKKEQDPSNFYMVIHAKQKTDTSNVDLTPGTLAIDENGNSPLQAEQDNLNNALLPGKKVNTVLMFTLKNNNPVTVEFSNADFSKLGTKTYNVE